MTKTYHNGPVKDQERSMTDVFCLIMFVIFNLAMLAVGVYAWTGNNFSRLSIPYDPDGKSCGLDYPQYPFIYFASPHPQSLYVTACLSKCPIQGDLTLACKVNSVVTSCNQNNNAQNTKAVQIYDTIPIKNMLCMPSSLTIQSQIYSALGLQKFHAKLQSLSQTWVILLITIPLCVILAIIFIFLMRLTAGIFVYLLTFLCVISLIALGVYLLVVPTNQQSTLVNGLTKNKYFSMIMGIVSLVLGLAIAILTCCFRRKIALASSIVKVATRFVNQNCFVMILQVILFVIVLLFVAIWLIQAIGIYSLGDPTTTEHALPFQHFQPNLTVKIIGVLHLFYLFWVIVFLIQTGDFIVAGTVTSWYFLRDQPFSESLSRYLNFHTGSVCVGSFLIALFGFLKFLYQILSPKQEQESGCMQGVKKFCDCCCYFCINWLFNILNNGAYTFIHLSGDPYCTSALEVLAVRIKDLVITGVVTILSVVFQILIRIGITALTCLIAYIIIKNVQPYKTQVQDCTLTMIIVGLIGFIISSFFVSLYSQAMEAISVCYLIDKEAGGSTGIQDKCPDQLRDFIAQAKFQNHTLMQ